MDGSCAHFTNKLVEVQQIKEIVDYTADKLTELGFESVLLDSEFLSPYHIALQRDRSRTCLYVDSFLYVCI